jgi:hypothetical protein
MTPQLLPLPVFAEQGSTVFHLTANSRIHLIPILARFRIVAEYMRATTGLSRWLKTPAVEKQWQFFLRRKTTAEVSSCDCFDALRGLLLSAYLLPRP